MRRLLRIQFWLLLLVSCPSLYANDGAFRGSGGNLIPIIDSSVSVQKEILTITRVNERFVEVDVYYEFLNEGEAKELLIGFEAMSPSGDVTTLPKGGEHPYISGFTVRVNDAIIGYKVSMVRDTAYFQNGVFKAHMKKLGIS